MTDIYWIKNSSLEQNLAIMPRPAGNDWLKQEINNLLLHNIKCVVSLLTESENIELGLLQERTICEENNISFYSYPIVDREVPVYKAEFLNFLHEVNNCLEKGEKTVIHCRMGIGRAGITAAAILLLHDYTVEKAIQIISDARGREIPDTKNQVEWLKSFEAYMNNNNNPFDSL